MPKSTMISFRDIRITGGFWRIRQERNRKVTIPAVYDRFAETGRMRAMDQNWREGMANRPHIFWDSDVAKWMEAVAYALADTPDERLKMQVEALIDKIEKHQDADGYFNSYFQSVEPSMRWRNRDWHELYCAGHLIEAAVAWKQTTGDIRFLRLMCRYADYIDRVFRIEKSAAFTCSGHEEIELALVKLWHETGENRYLELAEYFLDIRGVPEGSKQIQDHMPVREQREAVGHSVRAMYLYCAMADVALETGDAKLAEACKALFENVTEKRMYVTGGVGQTYYGEAFTKDYDLPNENAYAETCAAIGLHLFARRMSLLEPDRRYADIAERTMYNGILSGVSLEGKSFFYVNPLEIDLSHRAAMDAVNDNTPRGITQRVEVFNCSCCPPNVIRFISSLGDSMYSVSEDTLYVHQYIESNTETKVLDRKVRIEQETNYPHDGKVSLRVSGMDGLKLALRIPDWADSYSVIKDGKPIMPQENRGYVIFSVDSYSEIELDLPMPLALLACPPEVHDNAGRVAVQRGPVVYCLEGCDNGKNLKSLRLIVGGKATLEYDSSIGAYAILLDGAAPLSMEERKLYRRFSAKESRKRLRFIPYYAFANREESDMLVWVRV